MRGFSVDVVAVRMRSAASTVRAHENGQNRVKAPAAERYAELYDTTPEWILFGTLPAPSARHTDARAEVGNYLRAWRERRDLTAAQLAKAAHTSESVIDELERQPGRLSDKWLRQLAPALDTEPGLLLSDPQDIAPEFLETIRAIPPEKRADALALLKVLAAKR